MASLKYEDLLYADSPVDYVVINEGEVAFWELLEAIDRGGTTKDIRGIASKAGWIFCGLCADNSKLKLKESGAVKVLLGVENFDDDTLAYWKKDINSAQISKAVEILNQIELGYSISLILFHPRVTIRQLQANIEIIERLGVVNNIENLFNYLRLIPGTALNPSKEKLDWEFEDRRVAKVLNHCLEFEDYYQRNISDFEFGYSWIKGKSEQLKKNLLMFANWKWQRFEFLKRELGMNVGGNRLSEDMSNLVFKINPEVRFRGTRVTGEFEGNNILRQE